MVAVDSSAAAAVAAFDGPAGRSAVVAADKLVAAAALEPIVVPELKLASFSKSDIVVEHTFAVAECKSAAAECS